MTFIGFRLALEGLDMKFVSVAVSLVLLSIAVPSLDTRAHAAPRAKAAAQNRCGWISNPTPANWYFIDRDGEWTMGVQGGYQMPDSSFDRLPDHGRQWVRQNTANYGYGCGCLSVAVDRATKQVTRVYSGRALPLAQCRADKRLPKM